MEKLTFTAEDCDRGERLDRFIVGQQAGLTRSGLEKTFLIGNVLVNGQRADKNHRIRKGDEVVVLQTKKNEFRIAPLDVPLEIFYEDEALLVVNKAKGMVVHPTEAGGEDDTLVNALLHHCEGRLSTIGERFRPGILHRIDKDTSGLLVVAKTDAAHEELARQVQAHTMLRRYEAVVYGAIHNDEGVVDAPIGRHQTHRTRMCVCEGGRRAVTHYRVLRRYDGFTHLELKLDTGRLHQIRVHMEHIGHPVAGDPIYHGPADVIAGLNGQCLHAGTLGFMHPLTSENIFFYSELPQYFTDFLNTLTV